MKTCVPRCFTHYLTYPETFSYFTIRKHRSNITKLKSFQKLFDFDPKQGFSGSDFMVTKSSSNAESIIHRYLASPSTTFDIFDEYPEIGKLFIKYNTPLCSSATRERLFSLAKHVLTEMRCRLKDENFESQLLLKANKFPSRIPKSQG